MEKLGMVWAICAMGCCALNGADLGGKPSVLSPLAYSPAPPCSKRPGVRAVRSNLVQLGDLTVSITAQATLENGTCSQSADLWVTQTDVSQQIDLAETVAHTFGIATWHPTVQVGC